MRPLDGTVSAGESERVIGFCFARNASKAGENPSLTLASDACNVPVKRESRGVILQERLFRRIGHRKLTALCEENRHKTLVQAK
jgi:hypothetical protein